MYIEIPAIRTLPWNVTHRNRKIRLYTISKMWFKENHVSRILKFYRLETQSQVWSYAHHILSAYPSRIWVDCRRCGSISSYTLWKCRYHILLSCVEREESLWGAEQRTFYTSAKAEANRSNSTRRYGLGSTLSQYHSNHNLTTTTHIITRLRPQNDKKMFSKHLRRESNYHTCIARDLW